MTSEKSRNKFGGLEERWSHGGFGSFALAGESSQSAHHYSETQNCSLFRYHKARGMLRALD